MGMKRTVIIVLIIIDFIQNTLKRRSSQSDLFVIVERTKYGNRTSGKQKNYDLLQG